MHGIELLESSNIEESDTFLRKVSSESPDFALTQYHLGIAALRVARLDAAEHHFRAATEHEPRFGAAWNNLGDVQMRTRRFEEAEASLRRATEETPLLAEAFYNLGTLMLHTGRLIEAESCLHRAIALQPGFATAYNNLHDVMARTGRIDQAESCVRQAIALAPDLAQAHYNLGNLMIIVARPGDAEHSFRRALTLSPDFAEANHNLGRLLLEQNRLEEAKTYLRKSAELRPQSAAAQNALGTALIAAQHVEEALACFRRASALDARDAEAHYNEGGALLSLNRLDEAVEALQRGYALAPTISGGRLMLGMALLKLGRYREGWPHAEFFTARRCPGEPRAALAGMLPEWLGQPLEGRSLVVQCDYGFGDAIQLVRFMPALKARGLAHLTLVCPPELKALFESLRDIDTLKSTDDHVDLRKTDYWCYLTSVPLRLDVTLDDLAATFPYLGVPSARIKHWARRLERSLPAGLPRVGLVSAGSRRMHDLHATLLDERRSLPHARRYAPLLDVPGVSFVSLHKDPHKRSEWRALPAALRPLDLMDEVVDFAGTAALISNIDLIVTTDTSMAHLAGALGRPCWLLLNFDNDWRWLHDRADSPWYPGVMRVFRQPTPGAWDAVIGEVTAALQDWAVRAHAPRTVAGASHACRTKEPPRD